MNELTEAEAALFTNSIKLLIPDPYIEWFKTMYCGDETGHDFILSCAQYLIETVLSDCLQLTKSEVIINCDEVEEVKICDKENNKRRSSDRSDGEELPEKKLKYDGDKFIRHGPTWTMINPVWPRRKQVIYKTDCWELFFKFIF